MKNLFYILFISLAILSTAAFSQSSCQTAFLDQGFLSTPLPPLGTVAPAGPDYGCLTMLSRPVWGYFISCDSTSIMPQFQFDQYLNDTVYASIVVWGPFKNKANACSNLTASNIVVCEDSILNTGWYIGNLSLGWLSGPGKYYYYMIATSDTISTNHYNTSHIYTQFNGGNPYICFECNDEVSQMYNQNICLISFDSTSQKTKLTWEKVPDAGVDGYIIYREAQGSPGPMDSIAYVSETLSGEFIDYGSHPLQYGEYYRLVPVDSCGNKHGLNEYSAQNTAFLQTNLSGNNTVNLNWNQFGAWVSQYEPGQYIHRGSSPQSMQVIDTVPFGVVTYTDITAPPGQQFYAVERRKLAACNPLRTTQNTAYLSAISNPSAVTVTGIPIVADDHHFSVSPIPAASSLNLSVKAAVIGNKLSIIDMYGKTVFTKFISQTHDKIDVSGLASGTYWLCVTGNEKIVKRIIISR